jgi:hypothetical protein
MNPTSLELAATVLFALAILHTFSVKKFQEVAGRFPEGSIGENLFHLLGEIEVVFGLWAAVLFGTSMALIGTKASLVYLESLNFTEPLFVFVIMAVSATRPVLELASSLIERLSEFIPLPRPVAFYFTALVVGPLLGSFITEPAAMTVTAIILADCFFSRELSPRLMYATLGLLFVNVSIGGTLTPFAAPPVLMVASKWNWDFSHMLLHFGYKAALAVTIASLAHALFFFRELKEIPWKTQSTKKKGRPIPLWISLSHLAFLGVIVLASHHPVVFVFTFLFFLGFVTVTKEYQEELRLKEGLLVGFFLGGLVVLGGPQGWWLEPLLSKMDSFILFLGTAGLTAITDNAALTYLGAQVPDLSDTAKYALVSGAVTGGGLTVIANAPNPAGYGILNPHFGISGISPVLLFLFALPPTILAGVCFWLL